MRFLILLASFLACISASEEQFRYWNGKKYAFTITEAMLVSTQDWNGSGNPPLSCGDALKAADAFIATLKPDAPYSWRFEGLTLMPRNTKWIWSGSWTLEWDKPMTGVWPHMSCYILMDGTVVRPVVSEHK